jgi:hypothetical protein
MKVTFSRAVEYVPRFNGNQALAAGDQIRATLDILKLGDFLDLSDTISRLGLGKKLDSETLDIQAMKTLLASGAKVLPKYVKLVNLFDQDGKQAEIGEIVEAPQFLGLCSELLVQLVSASMPGDPDVKN